MNDQRSILVVDDDEVLRSQMSRALQRRGLFVQAAANYDEALLCLQTCEPDFAVIDLKMPGPSGMEVLKEVLRQAPDCRAVVLTGYGSIANAVQAIRLGAVNYVTKPADVEQVLLALARDGELEVSEGGDLRPVSLASAEWNHIQQVLQDCEGNITRAARALDIPRRTLQRKLKKLAP